VRMDDVEPFRATTQLPADPPADREVTDEMLEHPAREPARHPEHEAAKRCQTNRHDNEPRGDDHVPGVDIRDQRDRVATLDERSRELKRDELCAARASPDRHHPPRGDEDAELSPPCVGRNTRVEIRDLRIVRAVVSTSFDTQFLGSSSPNSVVRHKTEEQSQTPSHPTRSGG